MDMGRMCIVSGVAVTVGIAATVTIYTETQLWAAYMLLLAGMALGVALVAWRAKSNADPA